jgi:hypothetical protein
MHCILVRPPFFVFLEFEIKRRASIHRWEWSHRWHSFCCVVLSLEHGWMRGDVWQILQMWRETAQNRAKIIDTAVYTYLTAPRPTDARWYWFYTRGDVNREKSSFNGQKISQHNHPPPRPPTQQPWDPRR